MKEGGGGGGEEEGGPNSRLPQGYLTHYSTLTISNNDDDTG